MNQATRIEGVIASWRFDRGYGFVNAGGIGEKIRAHHRQLRRNSDFRIQAIRRGTKISFLLVATERGLQAHDIVIATD
jgi:cold shock CspA family protein